MTREALLPVGESNLPNDAWAQSFTNQSVTNNTP